MFDTSQEFSYFSIYSQLLAGYIHYNFATDIKNVNLFTMIEIQELYRQYYPSLLRFSEDMIGCHEDAENVLHDVFLNILNRKENLENIKNIKAWLFHLVKNSCLDHLKHLVHVHEYEREAAFEFKLRETALKSLPEEELLYNELQTKVNQLIAELPDRCREVFILNRMERLKYQEIAEKLGISENTVSVHMSIAVKRLRAGLQPYIRKG